MGLWAVVSKMSRMRRLGWQPPSAAPASGPGNVAMKQTRRIQVSPDWRAGVAAARHHLTVVASVRVLNWWCQFGFRRPGQNGSPGGVVGEGRTGYSVRASCFRQAGVVGRLLGTAGKVRTAVVGVRLLTRTSSAPTPGGGGRVRLARRESWWPVWPPRPPVVGRGLRTAVVGVRLSLGPVRLLLRLAEVASGLPGVNHCGLFGRHGRPWSSGSS